MKDKNDHDARGMLRKNRAEMAGRRLARDASALESRLGRVEQELAALHVEKRLGRELFADYTPWPKPLLLRLELDDLTVGSRRLLGRTVLDIGREDKLTLMAPNGSGKTCLLRELERQNERVFAESVYLPQTLSPGTEELLRLRLRELVPAERGRVLGLVAALGSDPDAVLGSSAWSPGEARKVSLALGLGRHAPALILDEPTNHFDLPSIERLERLLGAFPGCVVLVTHDDALAERAGTRALGIERGELVERTR
jgi:ATPase subunit of ABC transporter with duplicated ATPase domains